MWQNVVRVSLYPPDRWDAILNSSRKTFWGKHIFTIQINCCSPAPALLQFPLWMMGTRLAVCCCFIGLAHIFFSTATGPWQLMTWWRRLPEKSNSGRLSFGKMQGYEGREVCGMNKWGWFEMDDYCWQRRNARPASEDNIVECSVCVLIAGVHSCMLLCLSLPEVLDCVGLQLLSVQQKDNTHTGD